MEELRNAIRDIHDFPKEGIVFKDITTLIKEAALFRKAIDEMAKNYEGKEIDHIISIESRGFIFGAVLAYKLGAGFIPVRKEGKLPHDTLKVEYELEYGTDTLEIHKDAIKKGDKVLICDDLLATGGSCASVVSMLNDLEADIIGVCALIELSFLNPREKLRGLDLFSLIKYK